MKKQKLWIYVAVLGAIFLAACGGGGGGGGGGGTEEPDSTDGTTDSGDGTADDTADEPSLSDADVATTSYDVLLPNGVTTDDIEGDLDGKMVFAGSDEGATISATGDVTVALGFAGAITAAVPSSRDVAGFVAERPAPTNSFGTQAADAAESVDLAVAAVNDVLGETSDLTGIMVNDFQTISRQALSDGAIDLGAFSLTTSTNVEPTKVAGDLAQLWGLHAEDGSVASIPSVADDESMSTTFTIRTGVLYDSADRVLISVAVVASDLAGTYRALTDLTTDPGNAVLRGLTISEKTDTFTADGGGGKADFLFAVDNSISMENEQINLANAASTFSSVLDSSGLDFKLGVVTTDSSALVDNGDFTGFTGDTSDFEAVVNGLGTDGSRTESAIFQAEEALNTDGSVPSAGFPRSDAQLSVIMISDEPDQYTEYSDGTEFDTSDNLFLDKDYIVHAIVDTDPLSRGFGPGYIELANATGGSRAPITDGTATEDSSDGDLEEADFEEIMVAVAQKAAGASSQFVLSETPISSTIAVTDEGNTVARSSMDGWNYNSSSNAIVFNGDALPDDGDEIEVTYRFVDGSSDDGSGDDTTDGGSEDGSTDDGSGDDDTASAGFAGRWDASTTSSSTTDECDGESDTGTITITDQGSGVFEVEISGGETFNGERSGDVLSSTGSYSFSEGSGITTTVSSWSVELLSDGNSFEGGSSFESTSSAGSCTGTTSIAADRL